ncbi:type I restriction endonuclease [Arthrobacter sp. UYCu723]
MDENDTCREYVLPAIHAAGWLPDLVQEQFAVEGENRHRLNDGLTKRLADYVLELAPGQPLMVIEAKRSWAAPGDGLQQATRYATKLDVPFAVSTNGHGWVLYNSVTGLQSSLNLCLRSEKPGISFASHTASTRKQRRCCSVVSATS